MVTAASKILFLYLFGVLLHQSQQLSLPSDPTYNAGVVEFIPAKEGKGKALVMDNLSRMKAIIESNESNDLDILVFPEYVLNNMDMLTYVPDPKDNIAPCDVPDYDWFLTEMSCAARSRRLYVVVNVLEKSKCSLAETQCSDVDLQTYNTNVVFDRDGRVISRYRKTHLYRYEWYSTNVEAQPELATFSTDFGVTFGHFICFDMLFNEPAQVLIRQMNITDIIYPTYWFSELPFLTAVQLQEGWAFANNVNLLAADASNPSGQNTGSGIYAGRLGRLTAAIYEEATTKLLTAKVPKHNILDTYQLPPVVKPIFSPQLDSVRFTKLDLLRDYNLDIFSTKLLEENFINVNEILCHENFCCNFQVQRVLIEDSLEHNAYRYRLAAYSGSKTTFQRIDSSNQSACGLIACTGSQLYTCGKIFPESLTVGNKFYFSAINVTGTFAQAERRLIMPSTLNAVMMPLTVDSFEWLEKSSNLTTDTEINMSLTTPEQDLLTFGIWANYYSQVVNTHNLDQIISDVSSPTKGSACSMISSANIFYKLLLFVFVMKFI